MSARRGLGQANRPAFARRPPLTEAGRPIPGGRFTPARVFLTGLGVCVCAFLTALIITGCVLVLAILLLNTIRA